MTRITEPYYMTAFIALKAPHVQLPVDSQSLFIAAYLRRRPVPDSYVRPSYQVVAVKIPGESTSSGPHRLPLHLHLSHLR